MSSLLRSSWVRVALGSLALTFGFMIFYGAVPSALMAWTNEWQIVEDDPDFAGRIRDAAIMGYHGVVVGITFYGFALYQRLKPVNADADEPKRDPGGYR